MIFSNKFKISFNQSRAAHILTYTTEHKKEIDEIVKACNEYQALKEENEKLKEYFNMQIDATNRETNKRKELQQQRDELVEMLGRVKEDLKDSVKGLVDNNSIKIIKQAEQLLQKVKE